MSPNGEGGNQPPVPPTAAPGVDNPLNPPAEPNIGTPDPLGTLESVVNAAKQAAAAQAASSQTPVDASKGAFEAQFGDPISVTSPVPESNSVPSGPAPDLDATLANLEPAPPVVENPSSAVAPLDPDINTVGDLLQKGPQVVENPSPATATETIAVAEKTPEQTPADKLRQKIAKDVDAFLEEVTKDKVPV